MHIVRAPSRDTLFRATAFTFHTECPRHGARAFQIKTNILVWSLVLPLPLLRFRFGQFASPVGKRVGNGNHNHQAKYQKENNNQRKPNEKRSQRLKCAEDPNRNGMINGIALCVCARAYNALIIDNKINCQYFSAKYRFLWIINAFAAWHTNRKNCFPLIYICFDRFCSVWFGLVGRTVVR